MLPLPTRISQASWSLEWPAGAEFGQGIPLSKQSLPPGLAWPWDRASTVLAALSGEGEAVPLDMAHQLLDSLDAWTRKSRAFLTWPATAPGFAAALVNSARTQDVDAIAVLAAYPDFCQRMMEQARALDPSLPTLAGLYGLAAGGRRLDRSRPADPARPAARPAQSPEAASVAPADRPVRSSDAAPETAADRPTRAPKAPASPPSPPAPFLLEWVARIQKTTEPAIARQALDQSLKSTLSSHAGNGWSWFDRVLLPEIVKLTPSDLSALLSVWPRQSRFVPDSPVEWMDQPRFWVLLREAGPVRRDLLAEGGLAHLVDFSRTDAAMRFEMATKMLPFTARSPEAFKQRLAMWQSFGGDLDEAPSAASQDVDLSSSSAPSQTVRQWIIEQDNAEWNAILAEGAAPEPPAQESRFRRPGGPG